MEQNVRILIVEDEFMISEDIAMRLRDFGYSVEGIATSADEAIEILDRNQTDLALLDVNIDGDLDGIDLAKLINNKYEIPFIFLTSLTNRAFVSRAKETNPSAYLLKPFNDRQVQIAIELGLKNFAEGKRALDKQEELQEEMAVIPMSDSLFFKKDTHFVRVKFCDIYYLTAESNYTLIYTKQGRFVYSCVLKKFESRLPENIFMRVHRSHIVNVEAITGFEGNYLMVNEDQVPVSKKHRESLFRNFKII